MRSAVSVGACAITRAAGEGETAMPQHSTRQSEYISARKKAVRQAALLRRDALSDGERRERSTVIAYLLSSLDEVREAQTLMAYASFRSEVDTSQFMTWCLQHGKRLALPRVAGARAMDTCLVHDLDADLESGAWGIPEPSARLSRLSPGEIDIVIVPGVAFDRKGGRLGYGGGYHDKYMMGLRARVRRIAVAFEAQVEDVVPRGAHDLTMDVLVTEEGVLQLPASLPSISTFTVRACGECTFVCRSQAGQADDTAPNGADARSDAT
jgi:5-formyltetrahydrofolate cyclo-ligase